MEMRGVEPLSEDLYSKTSPITVGDKGFPPFSRHQHRLNLGSLNFSFFESKRPQKRSPSVDVRPTSDRRPVAYSCFN